MEENQVKIPEGWKERVLREILSYEQPYKYSVNSTNYESKSGIPVLTAGKSFILGYTTESDGIYSNLPVIIFDDFTTDTKYVDFPFKVKSSAMKFLKPRIANDIELRLVYEYLQALKIRETGGDHKRRWISEFSKFKIVLPEFPEQTQIATILSKVDEAIAQTEQLIAKYSRIKTGLMQDLLTKGIDEHGNIRSEETHEFKDSPLGRIPKEWDCVKLNTCIELHNNKRQPISSLLRSKMIGEYPYYGATGIIDKINEYRVEGEFVLIGEDGDHYLKWAKQEQTILVNGRFNVSNHAHVIKGSEKCSTKWIHYFFSHRDITFYLTRQGAGRFKLNKASLLSLPILIPNDLIEQTKIISKIENINSNINILEIKLSKLQSIKTGLMQDLLSGKVRVNKLIKEKVKV